MRAMKSGRGPKVQQVSPIESIKKVARERGRRVGIGSQLNNLP